MYHLSHVLITQTSPYIVLTSNLLISTHLRANDHLNVKTNILVGFSDFSKQNTMYKMKKITSFADKFSRNTLQTWLKAGTSP